MDNDNEQKANSFFAHTAVTFPQRQEAFTAHHKAMAQLLHKLVRKVLKMHTGVLWCVV